MAMVSSFLIYAASFLAVLTAIIFVHEWGHYIVARLNGVRVEVFSIGFGPELTGWNDRHGTRWKISMVPLGGYVKFFGDAGAASAPGENLGSMTPAERAVSYHHKRLLSRAAVTFAGPAANFIFAAIVFAVLFATVGQPFTPALVGDVVPGSAAAEAGFQPGDRIVAIDGSSVERFEDIRARVALSANTGLSVTVVRGGAERQLTVTPRRVEVPDGFGGKQRIGQIGIKAPGAMEFVRHRPLVAVWYGIRETGAVASNSLVYLGRIFTGKESGRELGGPLRIAQISGEVAQVSLIGLVQLVATLSVSIGLINLFPIPMLDGGHLLFYAVEAVRGRPLGARAQDLGFRVGLLVVLSIFVFATWNDLVHLGLVPFITGLFS